MAGICVWISSLPSTKIEVNASAAEADYKTKVCLNREAEFVRCARLAGDGGSDYDDSILAIAHIEPAFIYNSLDLLDDAQTSQYRFWRRFAGAPMDGAINFFNITRVFAFKSYQPKQNFSRSRVKSFFTTLEEGEPERLLATLRHNGHVPHWVDVAEAPVVMMRLPTPFARLVSSGRWTSVGVCGFQAYHNMSSSGVGWHKRGHPSLVQLRRTFPLPCLATLDRQRPKLPSLHDPEDMQLLADLLREAGGAVLRHGEGMTEVLSTLHFVVSALQLHEDEFRNFLAESMCVSDDMMRPATRAFHITFLISCFWATGLLRHDHDLREILTLGVSICLPQRLAKECSKYLVPGGQMQMQLPSKATMSRMRGRIDAAWMMMTRDILRQLINSCGLALYVQVDASPQGGRDYDMIVYNIVKATDFLDLFQYISQLESFRELAKDERSRCYDKEAALMCKIREAIQWHVVPMVCLGQGRGSLALKFRAILHAFGLLTDDREMLSNLLRSIVSWHSDYGTEIGIARVVPQPIETVLPYMHQPARQEARADPLAPTKEEQFDECAEIMFNLDSACQEEDFGQEVSGAPRGVAQGPSSSPPLADVTNSREVPGMMHICHNATNGLRKCLAHFEEEIFKLKKIAKLLRVKESKDRVLATCFSSGAGIGFMKELRSFHAEVYWERWHTVAHCINCIIELEVGLRTCWKLNKYLAGADKHERLVLQDDADDEHNAALSIVDEAISSEFFWVYMHMLQHVAEVQTTAVNWVNSCS